MNLEQYNFDLIIALGRGGLALAQVAGYQYNIKHIEVLQVSSDKINHQATILEKYKELRITGCNVLIVDDLVDYGASMQTALDYIKSLNPKMVKTLVAIKKAQSSFTPDFYLGERGNDWIDFIYEKILTDKFIQFYEYKNNS